MSVTLSFDAQATEKSIVAYQERANKLTVRNAGDYALALLFVKEVRHEKKQIHLVLDGFVEDAKQNLAKAKARLEKYIIPLEQIDAVVSQQAERWRADERRRAAEEEARLNAEKQREAKRIADEEAQARAAELRKAGNKQAAKQVLAEAKTAPPPIVDRLRVAPSIPKVSGVPARVLWHFRIVDEKKIPRKYLKADEVRIGAEVRAIKDKAKAEAEIPGIEVYTEDSV